MCIGMHRGCHRRVTCQGKDLHGVQRHVVYTVWKRHSPQEIPNSQLKTSLFNTRVTHGPYAFWVLDSNHSSSSLSSSTEVRIFRQLVFAGIAGLTSRLSKSVNCFVGRSGPGHRSPASWLGGVYLTLQGLVTSKTVVWIMRRQARTPTLGKMPHRLARPRQTRVWLLALKRPAAPNTRS